MTEWVEWAGGICPVSNGNCVEMLFRNGAKRIDNIPLSWYWTHSESSMDIVAYRVIEPVITSIANQNPKAQIGSKALPMSLLSPATIAQGCLAKLNGKEKYGGSNYIGTEVVMSIYMDAILRHFYKILLGEDADEVDNVPHWGAIIANVDIIISAKLAGTLIDDRLRSDGQLAELKRLTPLVGSIQELHKDKDPQHYYLKDINGTTN